MNSAEEVALFREMWKETVKRKDIWPFRIAIPAVVTPVSAALGYFPLWHPSSVYDGCGEMFTALANSIERHNGWRFLSQEIAQRVLSRRPDPDPNWCCLAPCHEWRVLRREPDRGWDTWGRLCRNCGGYGVFEMPAEVMWPSTLGHLEVDVEVVREHVDEQGRRVIDELRVRKARMTT